jgi:hypothetical protein
MEISVAVSLTGGNYLIYKKDEGCKLSVITWDGETSSELKRHASDWIRAMQIWGHRGYWVDRCKICDAETDKLPDMVYLIVSCNVYDRRNEPYGCSWGVFSGFVSLENAEKHVAKWEHNYIWNWIIPCERVKK